MGTITDFENKEKLIQTMGPTTGGLFYLVFNQTCELRIKFSNFKEIYGKNEETIELLNTLCSDFFGKLQIIMKDDLNLSLSRLLDRTKNTASLFHLLNSISDSGFRKELKVPIEEIYKKAEENLTLRHSRLAHVNKNHRLNSKKKLIYLSRASFKDLIDNICLILNQINKHFNLPKTIFTLLDESPSSKCLILTLNDALNFQKINAQNKPQRN